MSLTAAETKSPPAQKAAAATPASNIPAQDAAEPTTRALQHRLTTIVWSRILLALPLQQQDQLRFECKKFHRALKPTLPCWVLVRTPQGEANSRKHSSRRRHKHSRKHSRKRSNSASG